MHRQFHHQHHIIIITNCCSSSINSTFVMRAPCSHFVPSITFFLFMLSIVVPSGPSGIQFHMNLSLPLGQLVIFSLFILGQAVPL